VAAEQPAQRQFGYQAVGRNPGEIPQQAIDLIFADGRPRLPGLDDVEVA
jgi:hypothetical protein